MFSSARTYMNAKLDLKSLLTGLFLGVTVTVAVAAASSHGTVGRYQISGTGNHGLLLDTATGQVWTGYFPTMGGKTDGDFFTPKNVVRK